MIEELEKRTDEMIKDSQCPYCGNGSFKLGIKAKRLLRFCSSCGKASDPDHPRAKGSELWEIWQKEWISNPNVNVNVKVNANK